MLIISGFCCRDFESQVTHNDYIRVRGFESPLIHNDYIGAKGFVAGSPTAKRPD